MTPNPALELVSTADLCEALKTRFDHCLLAGMIKRPEHEDKDKYLLVYSYSGSPLLCLGLSHLITAKCERDLGDTIQETTIDDL